MVTGTEHIAETKTRKSAKPVLMERIRTRFRRVFAHLGFSSLTGRILFLNLAALVALVGGILYLNQFRAGLIEARVQSLTTQGQIVAAAIAASATVDTGTIFIDPDRLLKLRRGDGASPADDGFGNLEFPINPERAAPILRRLISPTKTRARIFDREGVLIADTLNLYSRGNILSFDLPAEAGEKANPVDGLWRKFTRWAFSNDLPLQKELDRNNGKGYPEVVEALAGARVSVVRVNDKDELIVSVAVPVQRARAVLGALVLSTRGGEIGAIVRAERWGIVRLLVVAVLVTGLLSLVLAGGIAGPIRRLAAAADRVRSGAQTRVEIPDFTSRSDEIGHLSGSLRDMTTALYNRIDAIESFAADVAHELKNPLTSLRSAVETLPLAKDMAARDRLIAIAQQDIRRLDRLISDISDASRLDAELAREEAVPVDMKKLAETVASVSNEVRRPDEAEIKLTIQPARSERDFEVLGHDSRLGQVLRNLIDNARSFSPPRGIVEILLRRIGAEIEIAVEDEGPGVRKAHLEKIFDRFYTDRPGEDNFGKNSGLGLSISKQIIEAHGGRIWPENRHVGPANTVQQKKRKPVAGARFVLRLPAMPAGRAGKTKAAEKVKAEDTAA